MTLGQELAFNGKTFDGWMSKVDAWIDAKYGVTSDDLIDFDYVSAFEDGASPAQAAKQAIAWQEEV